MQCGPGGLTGSLMVAVVVLMASSAAAQDAAQAENRARAAELEAQRSEARAREADARLRERERSGRARAETIELQLKEAEERLADAAAQVAELSRRRLPDMAQFRRYIGAGDRPLLGVTIGSGEDDGPVEGVAVQGVTPGSAAAEAGLRGGDVLTAVNDQGLSAEDQAEANDKLLEFMAGVEEGDTLTVEYLRDGKTATVEVEPHSAPGFAWAFGDGNWHVPVAPPAPGARWFGFHTGGS